MSEFGGSADSEVTEAVAEIARAAVRPDLEQPFADAENFILATLVELLGGHKDVSYFEPLLRLARSQVGGVDVITLNYDLTVETAAAQGGVSVFRGIESWRPGENLEFPVQDGTLNLMKLHGSLDWREQTPDQWADPQLTPHGIAVVAPGVVHHNKRSPSRDLPWIVVGDREKLATDGPTLALNFSARAALLRANHLSVVGYSFGDAHINAMIRDWLAADSSRTMSILDLFWPRERYSRGPKNFRSALVAGYARQRDHKGRSIAPRVQPVEGKTSERLEEALLARPTVDPDQLVSVAVTRGTDAVQVNVTWHGSELTAATLTVWPTREEDEQHMGLTTAVPVFHSTPIPLGKPPYEVARLARQYETWPRGSTVTVYAALDTMFPVEISVEGASIVGGQSWKDRVDV